MRLAIPPLHRCQGRVTCQAWISSPQMCVRCRLACVGLAQVRVDTRTADLLTTHEGASVEGCIALAEWEEQLINGVPGAPVPRGLIHAK